MSIQDIKTCGMLRTYAEKKVYTPYIYISQEKVDHTSITKYSPQDINKRTSYHMPRKEQQKP